MDVQRPVVSTNFVIDTATFKMEDESQNKSSSAVKADFIIETENSNALQNFLDWFSSFFLPVRDHFTPICRRDMDIDWQTEED